MGRLRPISPIAVGLIASLSLVFAAAAVVAIIDGIKLSRDLTYGDLLVGLGTFALAVLTAVLADATFAIDKRAADRELRRQHREVRGIARLIDGELAIVQESWEWSDGAKRWDLTLPIPHRAWDGYAAIVLQEVDTNEGFMLIKFFNQLVAWESQVAFRGVDQIDTSIMGVDEDAPWHQQFVALRQPLSRARAILGEIVYK